MGKRAKSAGHGELGKASGQSPVASVSTGKSPDKRELSANYLFSQSLEIRADGNGLLAPRHWQLATRRLATIPLRQ